jgi:hypothetical protein
MNPGDDPQVVVRFGKLLLGIHMALFVLLLVFFIAIVAVAAFVFPPTQWVRLLMKGKKK